MERRQDRGQATRKQIIKAATRLFTDHGYEHVSVEAILQECAISRGALYHHFCAKEEVFRAVLEAVQAQVAERVAASAADATNPLDGLRAGCAAWLRLAASDKAVRQIVLTDGPSVVGWTRWRAIDEAYSLGLLRGALSLAAEAGRLRADQVDLFAHMLLAVLVEIAFVIAATPKDEAKTRAGHEAVERVISALFGLAPDAPWPVMPGKAAQS